MLCGIISEIHQLFFWHFNLKFTIGILLKSSYFCVGLDSIIDDIHKQGCTFLCSTQIVQRKME